MQPSPPPEKFRVKEIFPELGGSKKAGEKLCDSHDLVEQMPYLYVRVVKARDLQTRNPFSFCDPFVEVKLGIYKGATRHFEKTSSPEWNQVFAFSPIQSSIVEVVVKDKDFVIDEFIGVVVFNLNLIPKCVPPDSPLAPQWYRLEDWKGAKVRGEIMLAVWIGTQADEAFPEAWHSDAAKVYISGLARTRSKVYFSPPLWYVRVNVIEAQGPQAREKSRYPEVYVKAILGNQVLRTKLSHSRTLNPMWNEDLIFVAAEPFEELLILSVEERVDPSEAEVLGRVVIPLQHMEKRLDHKAVNSRWYNLEEHVAEGEQKKTKRFVSRLHLKSCLDGGYHVLDESTDYCSDLRPTAEQLQKPRIGFLELGILNAEGLMPMKTRDGIGTTDAYCVARYGKKWVRTRTIIDCFNPKWNEQYSWEVFDPCTVITIGVFDNCLVQGEVSASRDLRIGKVRIRLSALETDRVYTHSYPLLLNTITGVKKLGELHLAVRFTCSSLINMLHVYSQPFLPKMHYLQPLTINQVDMLRHQAIQILSMRLARAEPPLRREVVGFMLDADSQMWSMRKSKAKSFWIMDVLSWLISVGTWFDLICSWKKPLMTILVHILFILLVLYHKLILPTMFMFLFLIGIWNYRRRPRQPPHLDTEISQVGDLHPEEMDEEFDKFPTSRPAYFVKMRYDRLRNVVARMQRMVGDLATQGERLQSLLSWQDTRVTALFVAFCFVASMVLYFVPFRIVVLVTGFYMLRPRWSSHRLPSAPLNFFRRLPAKMDCML